jgi:hypothetical protein
MATKKLPPLPSFNDIMALGERPTLVGKALHTIVGFLGAGSGKAIVSVEAPRFGQVIQNRLMVRGYTVGYTKGALLVAIVANDLLKDGEVVSIWSQPVRITERTKAEMASSRNDYNILKPLAKLYKCGEMEEEIVERWERGIREMPSREAAEVIATLSPTEVSFSFSFL